MHKLIEILLKIYQSLCKFAKILSNIDRDFAENLHIFTEIPPKMGHTIFRSVATPFSAAAEIGVNWPKFRRQLVEIDEHSGEIIL